MVATPLIVQNRPFAVEPLTNIMMPDGVFDNALYEQLITCHYTNTSNVALTNVSLYLESVADPGIAVTGHTYQFPVIPAGASVLVSWAADFETAVPGKPLVSFMASADGYTARRTLQQIFVSQTRYDELTGTYVWTVPEGELHISQFTAIPPGPGGWLPFPPPPPPTNDPDWRPTPWPGPHVLDGVTMTWFPNPAYAGTHATLPFEDPIWWKIAALIVALLALIVGIIAAAITKKPFNVGIKGKFDVSDTGLQTQCCTPAPSGGVKAAATVAGVCGAIASAGLATALSDAADPFWRGQAATPPARGELTTHEVVAASWTYLDPPRAGTPYRTDVRWAYERVTTGATYQHSVSETQQHIHVTKSVAVTTPGNADDGFLRAQAVFTRPDNSVYSGPQLYVFALFQAPQGLTFVVPMSDDGLKFDTVAGNGVYTGGLRLAETYDELAAAGQTAQGRWRVYVFAQDVNRVPPGLAPHVAAQTIGGFFVASAAQVSFDPDAPCPLEVQASMLVK
jgi:hypothetical protein